MSNEKQDTQYVKATGDERTANNIMRHNYRVLSDNEKIDMAVIKDTGLDFIEKIDTIATHRDDGMTRELALAKTKIEEAVMWAVKHITR